MQKRLYFPNLNGLRFIAAFLVIMYHVAMLETEAAFQRVSTVRLAVIGRLGVILFFVLSGFLITYLLLEEKAETGTISLRYFYFRRILRIWPLYYGIGFLAFVVLPGIPSLNLKALSDSLRAHWALEAVLFLCFLPNVASILFPPVLFAGQAWSVGVEEQFYMVWPLLMRRFEATGTMLGAVVLLSLTAKILLILVHHYTASVTFGLMSAFWNDFPIDCMAVGGMVALVLFQRRTAMLCWIFKTSVQVIAYGTTIVLMAMGFSLRYNFHYELYAVLFAIIIGNLAGNPKSIVTLENRLLTHLGKISYGLYMYHPLSIMIAIWVLRSARLINGPALLTSSVLLTIAISHYSYEWFEHPFIAAKVRYSQIVSGDNA